MTSDARLGNGRYVVRGLLGEGAQGATYDAHDTVSGRSVAIKRFDVRGARSWKDVELAEREARVLATLDHPLVPRYFEHFEEDGALYLVMEKVEGETLEAIIRRDGPLSEAEARRFLASVDRALTYLHGRSVPVIHRDIKPRNVIRRPDGSYVLVDFGAVSERISRRGASTVVGTLGTMAPEQLQGRAMPATDVYGAAATALIALTGIDGEALPYRGLRVDVRAALAGRASPAMTALLERALEPDPERRPPNLASVLDAPSSAPLARSEGDEALVKSIRKLLFVLWALAWVTVPVLVRELDLPKGLIPIVMFGSLAAILVVTWHKGALIAAAMRMLRGEPAVAPARVRASTRPRVAVDDEQQVRVHTADLRLEELVGPTELHEIETSPPAISRRA